MRGLVNGIGGTVMRVADNDKLRTEIERLLAAQDKIKYYLARLVDNAGPVSPGCDPQSWGAGFQTAHQMALNIMNKAFANEQNRNDSNG